MSADNNQTNATHIINRARASVGSTMGTGILTKTVVYYHASLNLRDVRHVVENEADVVGWTHRDADRVIAIMRAKMTGYNVKMERANRFVLDRGVTVRFAA